MTLGEKKAKHKLSGGHDHCGIKTVLEYKIKVLEYKTVTKEFRYPWERQWGRWRKGRGTKKSSEYV